MQQDRADTSPGVEPLKLIGLAQAHPDRRVVLS